MRAIFNAPDRTEAERLLKVALDLWRKAHPKPAEWAEAAIPESLTVFDFPTSHRIRLRTTRPCALSAGNSNAAPGWRASSPTRILPAPGS
jgi:transposase-like protein